MDMDLFIQNCDDCYVGILLYQCNNQIGERLVELSSKNKLVNVYIIGLLQKYNNRLIDKLGVEGYLKMIDEINVYFGGKKSQDYIIKKNWFSEINRKKIFEFIYK
jgi:hypothetical protein